MANKQATVADLQARLAQLEGVLRSLGVSAPAEPEETMDPRERADYVERGSDRHAALLGIRKADNEDELVIDGWTLEDFTAYGPTVTQDFLRLVLRQKVNELTSKMPEIQSKDPLAPNFRPVMWTPKRRLSEITE
jgi:hypothetical protein